MSYIELQNLVKRYGSNTAVADVSLSIEKGELFGLLGPNGAGKSTTISMLSGLLEPTQGQIRISGINVVKKPMEAKKVIGLVPQEIALYPTLTAEENLDFWGRMYNLPGKVARERTKEVLNIVGLEDRKDEKIKAYSGGMKRRINIAAALMHKPELLIMDEPTVGIDPQSRNHILETVKSLNKEGMTVIYTSHYMEEVEFLCKRVGIIDHGKVIAVGDKDDLKRSVIKQDRMELEVSPLTPSVIERIKSLESVTGAEMSDGKLMIDTTNASEILEQVLSTLSKMQVRVRSIKVEDPNLETVFLHLTGRGLRD